MIKKFEFPSYNEWKANNEMVELQIGYYNARISASSWGCNGNTENTYCAAIACNQNPHNIYSDCLVRVSCRHDWKKHDENELRAWYEMVCEMLNEKFTKHIQDTYLKT